MIRKHTSHARRVVFETGSLSTWFYHALTAEGIPAICIEARHAQKVLNETLNKTDANDGDGLAQPAEAGFYKTVRIEAFDSMSTHAGQGTQSAPEPFVPDGSVCGRGRNTTSRPT